MLSKELDINHEEVDILAVGLTHTFIQRPDLYARQLEDGRYVLVPQPLKPAHILAHLKGSLTLGTYILDQASRTHFLAFDADDDVRIKQLVSMAVNLTKEGLTPYLEASRRGGHLWLFLAEPVPGKDVREFGLGLLTKYSIEGVELFPKQDCLKKGPGSLIRLPFGIHRRNGQRYGFYTADLKPIAPTIREQIKILNLPKIIPLEAFEMYRSLSPGKHIPTQEQSLPLSKAEGKTLSERIKNSISVLDFVSQYVELSLTGRGLCPFHEDQHSSFSVNADENYWHCFAGCGGGSIIDFWMKWRVCDFTTAVHELGAKILDQHES